MFGEKDIYLEKIFGIKEDGKCEEFSQTNLHVDHEESVLENWLESETRVRPVKGIHISEHAKL